MVFSRSGRRGLNAREWESNPEIFVAEKYFYLMVDVLTEVVADLLDLGIFLLLDIFVYPHF